VLQKGSKSKNSDNCWKTDFGRKRKKGGGGREVVKAEKFEEVLKARV